MNMEGFEIAPDDLAGSTIDAQHEKSKDPDFDFSEELFVQKNLVGIRVDLIPEVGDIHALWLPISAEGKFQFKNIDNSKICDNLYFWAEKDSWYVCAIRPIHLIDMGGNPCHTLRLTNRMMVSIGNAGHNYKIYIEAVTTNSMIFHNYQLCSIEDIVIGRSDNCDIICQNQLISEEQAIIYWEKSTLLIKECNGINGLWINGKKSNSVTLQLGDVIYFFDLTIIVGAGFISINDENPRIFVKGNKLRRVNSTKKLGFQHTNISGEGRNSLFNRLPRRKEAFESKSIIVEAPPISLSTNSIPLMLRMGGSMVMGGASALSGNYVMLLSSVLFPILTQKYSDKEKKQYEERRLVKYRQYLEGKRLEIQEEKEYEERVLRQNYPDLDCVLSYSIDGKRLWERRKTDNDFLCLRIGSGELPMIAQIEYPDQHFNMEIDVLEQEMYELVKKPVVLNDVPILVDFMQNFICSIAGTKRLSYSFVERMIMMLTILHSYDEVKIVILAEKEELQGTLEFVKYIPHVWDDQKSIRFIATEPSEAFQIGELIKRETETDIKKPRELKEILKQHPYYMVFALSKRIFDSMEILKELIQQEKTCGVSVITAFNDLPKECALLFNLRSSGDNSIVYLKENSRKDDAFKIDRFDKELSEKSMKSIANTSLRNITQAYSLPKTITFLEMYKVGRVEHLNVAKRWTDNNPVKSLAVPVGVATDGSLFYLDLHQKYQGPHGLVAGTTGSGKSEFLLTYILSMAINFHPDEVAFVLIDYKGGGLAGAFDDPIKGIHLPHLVGTITNLDGALIQRSLVSIQSELMRRQRIFNKAKLLLDEGTMDIYTYQRLYRNKIVSEPMPHLFIISDEFAELKQQQPEFMDQLISAARIGRSLGVHLILATQKPAGVVNDQIRSNTKFRVCFKVQDKSDSQDMLKRPEAVELKDTGRFYLQVGYNDFFALGQSGWSGANYEPQDEVVVRRDESVQIIDSIGQSLVDIKPIIERSAAVGTQLIAIVKMLSDLSINQNIKIRQLWKPELKKQLDAVEINDFTNPMKGISCAIGMIDDPENQEQYILNYNFEQRQHLLIVGDSSSGKTSLLQEILYLLSNLYTPSQVNFYVLDYSSRMLKRFRNLPHCGAVLLEDDEDLVDCFFGLINNIVLERKKLFSELGVDNYSAAKEKVNIPLILVMIDNITGLGMTKKGEQYLYKLQEYLKDSLNYGVKYIATCSHLNDVSSRLRQEFGERLCLHMKDKYEYSDALNCKVTYTPPEMPGRGLCVVSGRPLEIQMAIYKAEMPDSERVKNLEEEITIISKKYREYDKAKRIPVISEAATYDIFAEQFSRGRIPLGYSKQTQKPIALPLKQFSVLSVYQGNTEGIVPVMSNFLLAAKKERMGLWFIKKSKNSHWEECEIDINQGYGENTKIIMSEQPVLEQLWHDLAEEISSRMEIRKQYCEKQGIGNDKDEIIEHSWQYMYKETEALLLLIENYADFCQTVDAVSMIVYDKLFQAIKGLNIYVVGFFSANDPDEIKINYLYAGFNPDEMVMLFGGTFDKQSLIELPEDVLRLDRQISYNVCLMKYRKSYHVLLMPCGEIEESDIDPDSQDIFV